MFIEVILSTYPCSFLSYKQQRSFHCQQINLPGFSFKQCKEITVLRYAKNSTRHTLRVTELLILFPDISALVLELAMIS